MTDEPQSTISKSNAVSRTTALVIAVAAFALGSGITWLFLRERSPSAAGQPPAYVIQGAGSARVNSTGMPPDVSQLPPAQAAVALGNWNYDNSNWGSAIENYKRAIALGLDRADVRTDLGNSYRFSGEPGKALEQYQIAQREDPAHENSLFNMGTLYVEALNDSANAAQTLQEYLRRFPNGEKAPAARKFLEEIQSGTGKSGQR